MRRESGWQSIVSVGSAVFASAKMMMPAYLAGTAPIAMPEEIILVLGDFTGDIWLMDL